MKKLIVLFLATAGLLLAAPTQPINNATLTGTTNLGAVGTINNTTGDIATQGSVTTGSGSSLAGTLRLKQGTAPTVLANTVQHIAPTSVTGYNEVDEATVGVTGYYKGTVSGTTATKTKVATIPAADVASGALANGMTATTQSAGDNSTKLATTAYVDNATGGSTQQPLGYTFQHYTQADGSGGHLNNMGLNIAVDGTEAQVSASSSVPNQTSYATVVTINNNAGIKPNGSNESLAGNPTVTCRLALNSTANVRLWIALSNGGSPMGSGTSQNLQYCVGFVYDTSLGDTNFMACSYSSLGNVSRVDTGVAADTAVHTFQFKYTSTSVTFYIDGVLKQTISTAANIPSTSQGSYGAYAEIQNLTGSIKSFNFQTLCVAYP